MSGKKVSGTFYEELALRVLCTKGTRHLFLTRCFITCLVGWTMLGFAAAPAAEAADSVAWQAGFSRLDITP